MSDLELTMMRRVGELNKENARLKAEVERLKAELSYDNRVQLHIDKLAAEFTQEQVERLTKAGDAMANNIPYYADVDISAETLRQFTDKWFAAKEGKGQS